MIRRLSTPFTKSAARNLRVQPSIAVAFLWEHLRGCQLDGYRFRRRSVVLGAIPAFWCPAKRVAIDVGEATTDKARRRDLEFLAVGITPLRFTPEEVFHDLDSVLARVSSVLNNIRDHSPDV